MSDVLCSKANEIKKSIPKYERPQTEKILIDLVTRENDRLKTIQRYQELMNKLVEEFPTRERELEESRNHLVHMISKENEKNLIRLETVKQLNFMKKQIDYRFDGISKQLDDRNLCREFSKIQKEDVWTINVKIVELQKEISDSQITRKISSQEENIDSGKQEVLSCLLRSNEKRILRIQTKLAELLNLENQGIY